VIRAVFMVAKYRRERKKAEGVGTGCAGPVARSATSDPYNLPMKLRFRLLPDLYSVARLPPEAPLPEWPQGRDLYSVTRTSREVSVVCVEGLEPEGATVQAGWMAIELEGPMPFELTGVAAELTRSLASRSISVFVLSTFDTDYVLVPGAKGDEAIRALTADGHEEIT